MASPISETSSTDAAAIEIDSSMVGAVGELHPEVAASFGIDVPCGVVELDLSALLEREPSRPHFREVSRQPQVDALETFRPATATQLTNPLSA